MGRPFKLCNELEQTNIRTSSTGTELAKRLPNGEYTINYSAAYAFIVNNSQDSALPMTVGVMNREFGQKGTWGRDVTVNFMLEEMEEIGLIERKGKNVYPLVSKQKANRILVAEGISYFTLRETLAGLHDLGNR